MLLPAQPTDAPPGKVEVVEMFWYGCPHCYALDPYLESWLKNKPAYIEFVRVPVMWGDIHRAHAQLFYTLQALGKLDELHAKVFDEIHQQDDELYVQGDPAGDAAAQLQVRQGQRHQCARISPTPTIPSACRPTCRRPTTLGRRYQIDAVPTIVIDGKYRPTSAWPAATRS